MSLEQYHIIFILIILCNINIQHHASHVLRQYQNQNHIVVNSTPILNTRQFFELMFIPKTQNYYNVQSIPAFVTIVKPTTIVSQTYAFKCTKNMQRKTKNSRNKYFSEKLINFSRWYISITQSVTNLYFSMKTILQDEISY